MTESTTTPQDQPSSSNSTASPTTGKKSSKVLIAILLLVGTMVAGYAYMQNQNTNANVPVEPIKPIDESTQPNYPESKYPELNGTKWIWEGTTMNDGTKYAPKGDEFVLSFNSDIAFSSTSDCNNMSGNYTYDSATGALSFGQIAMTAMYCEGSVEGDYLKGLNNVEKTMFEGDNMYLLLKMDSGSMSFRKQ